MDASKRLSASRLSWSIFSSKVFSHPSSLMFVVSSRVAASPLSSVSFFSFSKCSAQEPCTRQSYFQAHTDYSHPCTATTFQPAAPRFVATPATTARPEPPSPRPSCPDNHPAASKRKAPQPSGTGPGSPSPNAGPSACIPGPTPLPLPPSASPSGPAPPAAPAVAPATGIVPPPALASARRSATHKDHSRSLLVQRHFQHVRVQDHLERVPVVRLSHRLQAPHHHTGVAVVTPP